MAKQHYYRAIFVTPNEEYYSKAIQEPCQQFQDAEYYSRKVKPNNPQDKYVTVEYSEEDQFL